MELDHAKAFIGREFQPVWDATKKRISKYLINQTHEPLLIDLVQKEHAFIVSKSGGGKSYLAGVLAEEVISKTRDNAVVIIDPLGNFCTLKNPNINISELEDWNRQMLRPEVFARGFNIEVWIPLGDVKYFEKTDYDRSFSLRASQFSVDCFCYVFDMDVLDPMANLFSDVTEQLNLDMKGDYDIHDLIALIKTEGETTFGFKSQTVDALVTRLNALRKLGIISKNGIDLSEMIKENKIVVFDLSMSSFYTSKIIVSFLAERILDRLKRVERLVRKAKIDHTMIPRPDYYIPPTRLIIDEAHNFMQNNLLLNKCIKEGRNVGLMLYCISQSMDLSKKLYSNISHLFVGPLNFEDDITNVRSMIPVGDNPKEFKAKIKSLTTGCFYYYDIDRKIEKLIRVRPRSSFHPASTELIDHNKIFIREDSEEDLIRKLMIFLTKVQNPTLNDIPPKLQRFIPYLIKEGRITRLTKENVEVYVKN
jgi:hypothetical protein